MRRVFYPDGGVVLECDYRHYFLCFSVLDLVFVGDSRARHTPSPHHTSVRARIRAVWCRQSSSSAADRVTKLIRRELNFDGAGFRYKFSLWCSWARRVCGCSPRKPERLSERRVLEVPKGKSCSRSGGEAETSKNNPCTMKTSQHKGACMICYM